MLRNNAGRRILEFYAFGLNHGLTGGAALTNGVKHDFRAGHLMIVPPVPDLDELANDDYRIVFTSRDGRNRGHRHDVTDMTDEEFIAFIEA